MADPKAVVLLSGGIDSTTCVARAFNTYGSKNVVGLFMHYGQRHEREVRSAIRVADYYDIPLLRKDLSAVFTFSQNPLLGRSDKEIPQGSYAEQLRENDGMALTYVPYRNGLFLSYAAAIAYQLGAEFVFYGAHADDAAGNAYPDCSENFYNAQGDAIWFGTGKKVKLRAPMLGLTKAGVVSEGLRLNAPYHLTWSCYEGKEKACGKCGTCIDRKNAFRANGVEDPILYEVR